MGLETGTAILVSGLLGAGASAVTASRGQQAQRRIAEVKRRQELAQRRSDLRSREQTKRQEVTRRRVAEAEAQQVVGGQLRQRDIRPIGQDISQAVLREAG